MRSCILKRRLRRYRYHSMSSRMDVTAIEMANVLVNFMLCISAFLCSMARSWCNCSVSVVKRDIISVVRMLDRLCSIESL